MLAVCLHKLCTQDSLVAKSFGGPCPADRLLRGTWTRLGRLVGALFENRWAPGQLLETSGVHIGRLLAAYVALQAAPGRVVGVAVRRLGSLGRVLGTSWG